MNKVFLTTIFASVFAMSASANAATRDLVFEEDETTEVSSEIEKISVKTTVLLTRDGQETTVLPSEEFKSGDKVKLLFTANTDGYVYWLAKGSSGQYQMLYPNAKAGMDNKITRNQEYTVPAKGSFRFDDTPGNEELLCILSTAKVPELEQAAANQFKDSADQIDSLKEEKEKKATTRDLVFEEEDEEDVNTVSQDTPVGEPFVAQYTLKHN